jgi:hypothetical protein
MRTAIRSTVLASLLTAIGAAAFAGPTDPPAGAIQATGKTLTEVEPRTAISATNTPGNPAALYVISQPGSYYLTGDVTGVAGKTGIVITVSNVRIDLNGFNLKGVPGSLNGVYHQGTSPSNAEIINGSIINWGQSGVKFDQQPVTGARFRNVRVADNGLYGITTSSSARIEQCVAASNGNTGFQFGSNSIVTDCQATSNGGHGFDGLSGVNLDRCTANGNTGSGIRLGMNSTVTNCLAGSNTANGLDLLWGCRASRCTANNNSSYGVFMAGGCALTESTAVQNATSGVRITGTLSTVSRCTFEGVSGFPVITLDPVNSVRIADNCINAGTYAVSGTSVANALVTGNQCTSQTSGAFNLAASAQVGATVTAAGSIGAVSPFANFVR